MFDLAPTPLALDVPVDPAVLTPLCLRFAAEAGCDPDTLADLSAFLSAPFTRALLRVPQRDLERYLVDDVYKARMHELYAQFFGGATVDFALSLRRSPVLLEALPREDPELWHAFRDVLRRRLSVETFPPEVQETLKRHFNGFELSQLALERSRTYGVAAVHWGRCGGESDRRADRDVGDAEDLGEDEVGEALDGRAAAAAPVAPSPTAIEAYALGSTAEAASHVETTLTQTIQQTVVVAQIRRLARRERERQARAARAAAAAAAPSASPRPPSSLQRSASRGSSWANAGAATPPLPPAPQAQAAALASTRTSASVSSFASNPDAAPSSPPPESVLMDGAEIFEEMGQAEGMGAGLGSLGSLDGRGTGTTARTSEALSDVGSLSPADGSIDEADGADEGDEEDAEGNGSEDRRSSGCPRPDARERATRAPASSSAAAALVCSSPTSIRTATVLLANSIARLALGCQALLRGLPEDAKIMLFHGRRASSRRYLLVQNAYARRALGRCWLGTSAILVTTVVDRVLDEGLGGDGATVGADRSLSDATRVAGTPVDIAPLVGTLAHEVMMIASKCLGTFDQIPSSPPRLAPICALLAHVLLVRATGGLATCSALPDTFGSLGFLAAALAADVPDEFVQDCRDRGEWEGSVAQDLAARLAARSPPQRLKVFDLFRSWRFDSGSYVDMATAFVDAWEKRWGDEGATPAGAIRRPLRIHSNLGSYADVLRFSVLPRRIRPDVLAFGTLADGFLPMRIDENGEPHALPEDLAGKGEGGEGSKPSRPAANGAPQAENAHTTGGSGSANADADGGALTKASAPANAGAPVTTSVPTTASASCSGTVVIKLCSVVMKAVQASHPTAVAYQVPESAGKLGDDLSHSKMQYDRRLPPEVVAKTKARLLALSNDDPIDPALASKALADAYHAVTRLKVLA